MSDLNTRLRAWARGMYATEAGVELLIRHGRGVYPGAPWITEHDDLAAIDHDRLLYESGVWSGGEQRVARIAASLLGGPPVDLSTDLPGLGRAGLELVLAAMAHASGSHEHSRMIVNDEGALTGFERHLPLFPWPAADRPTED